ncbi:MAG TPA: PAS domain-containing sensor histidine kinase [Vitreimonas sp.]|uniref:PAS domain-containing sensor histidine kinase n=1 Tax=Vitreimonas sp. TaxID=3069702 RepID=UPI002D5E3640|nr:PAS domain-containing sensor histidine kinase [Vitreimonas sp.]HYD89205.1 PAS domain-containing sensor histidine kinase [Vitreimonas sp.]
MSNTAAYDEPGAAGPASQDKSGRPFMALVAVFVLAFAAATGAQIKSHIDDAAGTTAAAQASTAGLIAERVNANLAIAVGATSGAAELARAGGSDLASLANAAAHASPATAAAVIGPSGAIEAITNPELSAVATAAANAAGDEPLWAGAPDMGELATAPTIVRRLGDRRIVTIIDSARLLPELNANARVLIASPSGEIFYASPALQSAGVRAQQQVLAATRSNRAGALIDDGAGSTWVAAEATAQIGGFRIMAASPAPSSLALLLGALLQYALVAATPLAAMGVLYLLMRQNAQRARLAEAEAVRAEAHFRIAADGAKVGVLEWRPGADEVQLSEQAARLLGAPRDTISLRDLLELVVNEDRFGVDEEFRRARMSGLLDARFRVTRSGGLAWIEARGAAVEDASGRAETRLFATVIDATQRHEAEARVTRLERQLRAAIENFSGPFALWDARKRLLLWNQSFARAFKLGPEILRPRASYEAIAAAATAAIRREKHDPTNPDVRVIELTTGDWLHIVERRAADGGVITVGVDITPLKRKEEELARNERRLSDALTRAESQEYRIKALAREAHEERQKAEEASRAKSTFLANMSHELRTPLNAVIGFSEIMAKELFGAIGNDQYKQYATDIFDSGNHLLELINDILDMAKIEAGKLTLSPRPLDPSVAIEQAVRLTKRKAEEKGLSVVVDAEDLPEIEADHRAVKQILLNLLSNAVKFTDQGAIMVHARANAQTLTLRVVDTGCGIPPEHLPRLARPFEQVEAELTRNNHGTGLGLALTKSLAEMHGGKLSIQSEVGRGTIVTITLPRTFGGQRELAPEATAAE